MFKLTGAENFGELFDLIPFRLSVSLFVNKFYIFDSFFRWLSQYQLNVVQASLCKKKSRVLI